VRQNRLREKIQRRDTAYGVLVAWPSPEMVEFFGHLGFDYVFLDGEHGNIGPENLTHLVRACDVSGAVPIVRVPENNPATILRYLETGVLGVIVPHISTVEQAEAAVAAARYGPVGFRCVAQSTRRANYGLTQSTKEYLDWANENILVNIMIEDREGISNLDDILKVEGVDVVTFGPGDLAIDLGYPGEPEHPEVQRVMNEADRRIQTAKPAKLRTVHAIALLKEAGERFLASG
jgi:4-hydroxy-2-oxoheptanedioate aldolase